MQRSPALFIRIALAGAGLCLATACRDDRPVEAMLTSAPHAPRLTSRNLPSDAPTICVANVRQRDRLLAIAHPSAANTRDISALDDVIDDVCR
jgi:hypothetical protein